jgi:5-formyltetrahydrofolate cyclo-ligase
VTSDSSRFRAELRARLRTARTQLSAAERIAAADALVSTLEQLPEFLIDARVAGYWAVTGELPLHAACARLGAREQGYYLPIVEESNTLRFAAWRLGATVQANRHGIPEPDCDPRACLRPDELDLVLLPLLGFDRHGNRLGTGAGYYDRSFAFLRDKPRPARPLLVGIGYHFQELPALTPESWDIPLDYVATDRELIACSDI